MNTKHTPGPWKVETIPFNWTPYIDSRAGSICSIGPCDDNREGWVPKDQDQANARLIASAPELLAALNMMVKCFNTKKIDPFVAFATIERAMYVISKAEGGSHE